MNKTFLILLAALILGGGFAEASTTTKLPDNDIAGSSVLVIHQKFRLIIGGKSTALLAKELGAKQRQQFFFDMILEKDVAYLTKTYGTPSHVEAIKAIKQYSDIMANVPRIAKK